MDQTPDFRPDLAAAQTWVADLVAGVRTDQLDAPTPCTDYDVRGLLEHIFALPAKLTAVAEGNHPLDQPTQVDIDPAVAGRAQVVAEQALSADMRVPDMPFGHWVDAPDDAGPTGRLAAFLGRSWPGS